MKKTNLFLLLFCLLASGTQAQWNMTQLPAIPGGNALDIDMADGRNDGVQRLYVTSSTGAVYEWTYSTGTWNQTTVTNSVQAVLINMEIGNGRNDGLNRIYFNEHTSNGGIFEATWSGSSWNVVALPVTIPGGEAPTTITVGDGRGDGVGRLYIGGTWGMDEYTWNGSSWTQTAVLSTTQAESDGEIGDAHNVGINRLYINSNCAMEANYFGSWNAAFIPNCAPPVWADALTIGDGRNDNKNRVYSNSELGGQWEFTYNAGTWNAVQVRNQTQRGDIHMAPLHVDANNRLYLSGAIQTWSGTPGKDLVEYEWNSTTMQWDSVGVVIDVSSNATGWMISGNGRNDDTLRLYAPEFASGVIYEVTATDANYIGNVNGLDESIYSVDISIYPSPATDNVYIKLESDLSQLTHVRIFNLLGEVVYDNPKVQSIGSLQVDCSSFDSGMYIVEVSTEKGTNTEKLIIE